MRCLRDHEQRVVAQHAIPATRTFAGPFARWFTRSAVRRARCPVFPLRAPVRVSVLVPVLVNLIVLGASLVAVPARADGFVIVHPQPDVPDPEQLAVRYHDVEIEIHDQVAQVHIDQVFRNLNPREVEGEYIFPVPDGAAVSDFVLWVEGQPIHAEAMDAQQARRLYEDIVRRQKDPALLEYAGRELYRARIYPFPAHGERRVELRYDQLITREAGLCKLVYPLSTEKFSSRPLESATVTIDLKTDRPVRNAYCPSHAVDVEYLGSRHVRVSWEATGTRPDRDLVFYYSLAEEAFDLRLVPYRPHLGEDGYFMMLASMGGDDRVPVQSKDVVFVVDRSGSMEGQKIEQAREALLYCLQHLGPEDRFNVVSFSGSVESFARDLVPASRSEIEQALTFTRHLHAAGGTNISGALEEALAGSFSRGRPGFIVFLTDGLPTRGERDPVAILRQVAEFNGNPWRDDEHPWRDRRSWKRRTETQVRIFPFGVGYDVGATFLSQLADENGGAPTYVRPSEDLKRVVQGFYDQVAHPVMTGIQIELAGARLLDPQPSTLPDIFRGRQLVLFGRYDGEGPVELTLRGRVGTREKTYHLRTELPRRERENEFVGRLWAIRKVGSLLREIQLYGEERELVATVTDLGLRFGIGTPYTSFLVDEEDHVPRYAQERPPQPSPDRDKRGWSFPLLGGLGLAMGSPPPSAVDGALIGDAPAAPHDAPQGAGNGSASSPLMVTGQTAFETSREVERMLSAKSEEDLLSASGRHASAREAAARHVAGRTFRRMDERWVQVDCPPEVLTDPDAGHRLTFGSEAYFELLRRHPELATVFALGDRVVFELDGQWYRTE